jgi:uncharacterized protein YhjY with autotransporter beta-barrel domain
MKFIERPDLLRGISRDLMESCASPGEAQSGATSLKVLALALAACLFIQTSASFAADLTWDRQNAPGIQGGSDDWNTANSKWQDSGGNNVQWVNDGTSKAIFETGSGTVILEDNIAVDGILFKSDGYTINRTSGRVLQIAGPTSITVQDAGETATINAPITGAGSINVNGLGTLVLTGTNTFSGGATITAGSTLDTSGTLGGGASPGVTNAGTLRARGTINGAVVNNGPGQLLSTGNLVINGTLTNNSNNPNGGVSVAATLSLSALKITNNVGATLVNSGTISSTTGPIDNFGFINLGGKINGGISNAGFVSIFSSGELSDGLWNSGAGVVDNTGKINGDVINANLIGNSGIITGDIDNRSTGVFATSNKVAGNIGNKGTMTASGTITGDVDNSGTGTFNTKGVLLIGGKLTNRSTSLEGVTVRALEQLTADRIDNQSGATITNLGTLTSVNPIENAGKLTNTGTLNGGISNSFEVANSGIVNGGITNTGTVSSTNEINGGINNNGVGTVIASGKITGAVNNRNSGTIRVGGATGTLTIIGTLTNSSTAPAGVVINANQTLSATNISNAIGATISNSGTLISSNQLVNAGTLNTTNRFEGGIKNGGTVNASGTIVGAVDNEGIGIISTTSALTIDGTLTNSSAGSGGVPGVSVNFGHLLSATKISNNSGATIIVLGTLSSGNQITNAGVLSNSGTVEASINNGGTLDTNGIINGSITNTGVVNAGNTINGDIANNGNGTFNATGVLTVNGTLTNSSVNPSGVLVNAGQSLTATNISNGLNSQLVNQGTLKVTGVFESAGIIVNSGNMNASIDGSGTGSLEMNGGTFTGSAANMDGVTMRGGTLVAGSMIDTFAFGQTGGDSTAAAITAKLRVIAIGGVIVDPVSQQGIEASNNNGDVTVISTAIDPLGNGGTAIKTSATGSTTINVAGPIIGNKGIDASGLGSIQISTSGEINTTSTAISINAGPAGGQAFAKIGGNINVLNGPALVSTGNAKFEVASGVTIISQNGDDSLSILESKSGTAELSNSGTITGVFNSGPGSVLINNLSDGTFNLGAISVFGDGTDSLLNSGVIIARSGAVLQGLDGLTNAVGGTIDMLDGDVDDTLVISGDMTLDAGSVISMNVDLSADPLNPPANGVADRIEVGNKLKINGGSFVLTNLGKPETILGKDLVLISAASSEASLATPVALSVSGLEDQGLFIYQAVLEDNKLLLRSVLDAEAAGGVVSNFITAQNAVSNAFFKPASGFVSSPLNPEPNQLGFSVWSRASGGFTSQGSTGAALLPTGPQTVESSVNVAFGGYQFGFDGGLFNIADSGANLHVGLTAGQVFGAASQKEISNKTTMQDTFVGAYGIFSDGPFFVDAQLRQEFIEYTVNIDDRGLRVQDGKDSSQRFSAGISGGYNLSLGKFSIVPAVGYTLARTSTDDFSFNAGQSSAKVEFGDTTSHLAFAGVSASASFLFLDDQLRVSPFISATAYHDFGKDNEATLVVRPGVGEERIDVTTGSGKTYGEVSLGANFLTLTPEIAGTQRLLSGNVRGDVQFGEDRLGGSLNAQVRLQF